MFLTHNRTSIDTILEFYLVVCEIIITFANALRFLRDEAMQDILKIKH